MLPPGTRPVPPDDEPSHRLTLARSNTDPTCEPLPIKDRGYRQPRRSGWYYLMLRRAKSLRKHVGMKALEQVVTELVEIPGDKDFRDRSRGSFTRCGWSLIGNHSRHRLAIKSQCLARCSW